MVSGPVTLDQPGVYTLAPCSRRTHERCNLDRRFRQFWLFGGFGYDGPARFRISQRFMEIQRHHLDLRLRRQHQSGRPERNLRHARHCGPDEYARWPPGSCGLGRCQRQPVAVRWRRRRSPPVLPMASSTTCGSTTSRQINGHGLPDRTLTNQTGTYPDTTGHRLRRPTTAAGTCGLAVGDATALLRAYLCDGAFPGSRWGPALDPIPMATCGSLADGVSIPPERTATAPSTTSGSTRPTRPPDSPALGPGLRARTPAPRTASTATNSIP